MKGRGEENKEGNELIYDKIKFVLVYFTHRSHSVIYTDNEDNKNENEKIKVTTISYL